MKVNYKLIFVHILVWSIIILLTLKINGQVLVGIRPDDNAMVYKPILVFNLLMICIFYLNYYIFIPWFLFKKRYIQYFLICLVLFLFITELPRLGQFLLQKPFRIPRPLHEGGLDFNRGRKILTILHTNSFLMYIVVFAASISLRMYNLLNTLQKEKYAAQLAHLKSQVNPHFLFNTLNSIYSVSLKTSPQAADMVSRLSEMMRYTMREAQMDSVELIKELENLTNYIELQKVRIHDQVVLKCEINGIIEDQKIAPLLLLPFVENAFKYGVNPESKSEIMIDVKVEENTITMNVKNTIVEIKQMEEVSGLGIENTVNRLNLIYPDGHLLKIKKTDDIHSVHLEIKIK